MLAEYNDIFSKSKFDVGLCNLINTKISLTSATAKHCEPERQLRIEEVEQLSKLINELLEYGIIEPADQTAQFCANVLCVPKPSDDEDPSKALPPVLLSSYKELQAEFTDTYVSTFDLSGFFFAIPLSY